MPSAYAPAVGGVEEATRQLARRLTDEGHVVEVWTIRHPADLPSVESIEGITVRRFAMPLPAAAPGTLARLLPSAGRAFAQMLSAARAFAPDLVHVQCFSANGIYAGALAACLRRPLIVSLQGETIMDDDDIYDHSATLRAGLRLALHRATAVTACSQFVLDDAVARFGLVPGVGEVVFNGVEVDDATPPRALSLPFQSFVLGFGRLVPKKGFDLLLDAFADLARTQPELGLVIAGRGGARPELDRRVELLGLAGRVVLPGVLDRAQVRWSLDRATAFVLPSRVEPQGIVALEALAAGCPAVVSSRGGAVEVVRDRREGLAVDPTDRRALTDAIARVISDTELRARMTAAGHARAREFDWGRVTARYLAVYGRARAAHRRTPHGRTPHGRTPRGRTPHGRTSPSTR